MITSQRIIAIGIFLNIVLGLTANLYLNPTTVSTTELTGSDTEIGNFLTRFTNDNEITAETDNPDIQEEKSAGSLLYWSIILYEILEDIINPFSISLDLFDTTLEKIGATIVILLRAIFSIFVIIEAYLIIKNKKAT